MDNIKIREKGLLSEYQPDTLHEDVIYFATDTLQLLLNGQQYGGGSIPVIELVPTENWQESGGKVLISEEDLNKIQSMGRSGSVIITLPSNITGITEGNYPIYMNIVKSIENETGETTTTLLQDSCSYFKEDSFSVTLEIVYPEATLTIKDPKLVGIDKQVSEVQEQISGIQEQISNTYKQVSNIIVGEETLPETWSPGEDSTIIADSTNITEAVKKLDSTLQTTIDSFLDCNTLKFSLNSFISASNEALKNSFISAFSGLTAKQIFSKPLKIQIDSAECYTLFPGEVIEDRIITLTGLVNKSILKLSIPKHIYLSGSVEDLNSYLEVRTQLLDKALVVKIKRDLWDPSLEVQEIDISARTTYSQWPQLYPKIFQIQISGDVTTCVVAGPGTDSGGYDTVYGYFVADEQLYRLEAKQQTIYIQVKIIKQQSSGGSYTEEEKAKVQECYDAVQTLQGTGEGSVTKTVTDEITKVVAGAPESFDTLKEIADWIQNHPDDSSTMNAQIQQNKENIQKNKEDIANIQSDQTRVFIVRNNQDTEQLNALFDGTVNPLKCFMYYTPLQMIFNLSEVEILPDEPGVLAVYGKGTEIFSSVVQFVLMSIKKYSSGNIDISYYEIEDESLCRIAAMSQAQYDALGSWEKKRGTLYLID